MPLHGNRPATRYAAGWLATLTIGTLLGGCSSNPVDTDPPTIEPGRAAVSPPPAATPAGEVLPLGGNPQSALYDPATGALVAFTPAPGSAGQATLTLFDRTGTARTVPLPAPVSAVTGDAAGTVFAATRGAVLTVDLAAGTTTRTPVAGHTDTDFTAIARRADGRLVLGSAAGTAYTLTDDLAVSRAADIFARVDAIVTQGDVAVVLDRGQTSVTALNADGAPQQALRAGLGATTLAADPTGRVLVTDPRGGQLMVYSVDPLIQRQAYPVGGSPFGVVGSAGLVWVSQTATNTVVGYDLSTGSPVEKRRYPTVRQPDSLAYDAAADILYVVSGAGAGVQVIRGAGGG